MVEPQQLSWLAGGALIFPAVASFDYRIISRFGYVLYGAGIVLLVAVLVHGKVVSGSRRWFDLGAFQPSELMKVLTITALAKYIHDTPSLDLRTLRHILVPLFLAGLPVLLVAAQLDLGTAVIIGLISATVVVVARLRMKTLAGIIVAGALALAQPKKEPWGTPYGVSLVSVDVADFRITLGDGRSIRVGVPCCRFPDSPCQPIPKGVQRLVNDLQSLVAGNAGCP